jgi:hypothetical protein
LVGPVPPGLSLAQSCDIPRTGDVLLLALNYPVEPMPIAHTPLLYFNALLAG